MSDLKKALIERDGISAEEADRQIAEAKVEMTEYLEEGEGDIQDFLQEHFGLEPDYFMDLL